MGIGGRPANLPLPKAQVWVESKFLGEVTVRPGQNSYSFDYHPESGKYRGDLIFTLKVPEAFKTKDHNLPLGVVVSKVSLTGGPEGDRPVIPSFSHLALLLALLVIFYLALFRAGWSALAAARFSGLLAAGLALALAFSRLELTPAVENLFLAFLLAYPLLVFGLWASRVWLKDFPLKETRWLGLIFVGAFVVKAAGLTHPGFLTIDHWFRVHQILRLWEDPAGFWKQYFNVSTGETVTGLQGGSAVLGQWGISISLPYSPLFYLVASPLARIWPTHDPNLLAAVNLLATWFEASSIFLIYLIAREAFKANWAGRAGLIAAALYGFYPLSFLLFSDGGFNSILAHWLTLFFVVILLRGFATGFTRLRTFWVIIFLALALLAHTSTLLLVGTLVIIATTGLGISPQTRPAARRLALIGLGGGGLAFGVYYGWYLIPFLRDSLPALVLKLSGGGIGQDRKLLGTDLLEGFWPQLWEHFRLFPFILTVGGLAALYPFWKWVKDHEVTPKPDGEDRPARLEARLFLTVWLITFLLFSLVDLKVNLLQKHMLFAAPLFCIGSGLALCLLGDWARARIKRPVFKDWPVNLLTGGLILFLAWQGIALWYGRVYFYFLPPGSG